jgi:deazaflavin-dependent oxidoreductase (nitroreductase family)
MALQTRENPEGARAGRRSVSAAWKRTVAAGGGVLQILWRIRLGWAAGHTLLVLTHVGRRTGKRYRTVLYVQRYDDRTREATVISVWGNSQWFRNISAAPAAQVEIGRQRYEPRQRFLCAEEIVDLEKRFRARHRIIAWAQANLMGWSWPATEEQLRNLCDGLRAVAFAPPDTSAGTVGDKVGLTCR